MVYEKALDFVVIGVQRAGTTSLFKYLMPHPNIYLPPEKEAPFFSNDDLYQAGWEAYARVYLKGAAATQLLGKITPHYMIDQRVPVRLHALMPKVKLIAILRDPVERAFSHYRLNVRRGLEKRPFDQALLPLYDPTVAAHVRTLTSQRMYETMGYLAYGEYHRILQTYWLLFGKDQLLILFSEALAQNPQQVMDQILAFLDLPLGFRPNTLGKYYNHAGTKKRIGNLGYFAQHTPAAYIWHRLPSHFRAWFTFWFQQWNTKDDNTPLTMNPLIRQQLVDYFSADVEQLRQTLSLPILPWRNFYSSEYASSIYETQHS